MKTKMASLKHLLIYGFLIFMAVIFSCEEDNISNPNPNMPPETDIFISYADTLNYTQSVQEIYWDGRDPDGFVTGFYYTWLENPSPDDWIFTEERSMVFPLKITGLDTIYLFQVKAVDDEGLEDPTPASQRFPIKNSAPSMKWTSRSRIPDTTFTVASFAWEVSDLDGDSTIDYFEYTLDDDTLNWKKLPGYLRSITLNADSGLTEGDHSFVIRAVDLAGARSENLRMPEFQGDFWHVRQPRGRYLLIDDFQDESATTGFADRYYKAMMNNVIVPAGEDFSYWNIKRLFPQLTEQFTQTMLLFDYVIWYADVMEEANSHFITAQITIPKFLDKAMNPPDGGKIIYSTMFNQAFGALGSPLGFSPVDSVSQTNYRAFPGNIFNPDSVFQESFPAARTLPVLKVSQTMVGIKALIPKATSIPMYRFQNPSPPNDTPVFVMIGRNDNKNPDEFPYDFVFSAAPLHQLKGDNNLDEFFDVILNDIFK